MKKFTIKKALKATDIGDEDVKLTGFEIEGPEEMTASDGYHTFDELYDHRITLFIALCRWMSLEPKHFEMPWRSNYHSDGKLCFGTGTQFVMGIGKENGKQISYHIPNERWHETDFAETLKRSPEWDGHTSADVLERIKNL